MKKWKIKELKIIKIKKIKNKKFIHGLSEIRQSGSGDENVVYVKKTNRQTNNQQTNGRGHAQSLT